MDLHDSHVFVYDPTDIDPTNVNIPIGKQTRNPQHIYYRSCTGLWQTVWAEWVPDTYISGLDIAAGSDGKGKFSAKRELCWVDRALTDKSRPAVTLNVNVTGGDLDSVSVSVISPDGDVVATQDGPANEAFDFVVDSPDLWTPDSPTLYNLTVTAGSDEITSYTGFRTVSRGEVNGIQRPLINGEFIFTFGTLDQGFWPDGLYTPPSYEAMIYDLQVLKKLGLNMLRKHVGLKPLCGSYQGLTCAHRSKLSLPCSTGPVTSWAFW